ncbi:hypothetical protein [Mycobacterium sp. GA-1285]|uniref:aa3-type cytochrome oxidase subunit CtaJ n=1 Tax=Mycobacterium sp. GA-1285 TaxID=1772282 RepID=UPI000A482A7F|nr:hypothetical protein [Mycobacterium sp. GA-1285]
MSTTLTYALLTLVPLGLTAVLAVMIWSKKGPHPASYKMSDPWKHAPILWAADEPADHGHATGRSLAADSAAHGGNVGEHDTHAVTIGGGASGKW